jgi:hypothetical protein
MSASPHHLALTEDEAWRLFRRCVWISLIPLSGIAAALGVATIESSLPPDAVKAIAFAALAAIFGGELFFCRDLGRLASGVGQSESRWSTGVWIASKFLAFVAWWLALLKMRSLLNRIYTEEPRGRRLLPGPVLRARVRGSRHSA